MKRRFWIFALVLMLVFGATPFAASAASEDAASQLYASTRRSYTKSLSSSGRGSFHGYCGTMVAHQLRAVGITSSAEVCDGNQMYDRFKNREVSSGGYFVTAYSAKEYSLADVLNELSCNGTRDVYNILVGFQWTSTEAGRYFGHAVFINGILDGTVYFVESYDSAIGGAEGSVIQLSIDRFADYYDSWTAFEGCIYFSKDYAETLQSWDTDLFVRARFAMQLRSQPCLVGVEDCQMLRTVNAGERLRVTRILCSPEGEWYYRVSDGDYTGYIVAQAAAVERINGETLHVQDLDLPESVEAGKKLKLSGTVVAGCGQIGEVEIRITDVGGMVVQSLYRQVQSATFDLSELTVPELPVGSYELSVVAQTASAYIIEDRMEYDSVSAQLAQERFWVGPVTRTDHLQPRQTDWAKKDGWIWQNGTWYCYENGRACTGWVLEHGVRYYLDENGAATTGWAVVDGQNCFFSTTGALCTGWISTPEGMHYCFSDGRFANGWQTIGASRYYFDEGLLQTEGQRRDGDIVYAFQADGKATPVAE